MSDDIASTEKLKLQQNEMKKEILYSRISFLNMLSK